MGYSTNVRVCIRMKPLLDRLESSEGNLLFRTNKPRSLAYKLREACFASRFHDDFQKYIHLGKEFSFRESTNGVLAVKKSEPRRLRDQPLHIEADPEEAIVGREIKDAFDTATIPEAKNLADVIGATIKYGVHSTEVFFPSVALEPNDLARLFRWAEPNGWKIIWHEEEGVTLTQRSIPDELAWKPEP